jgi:hypothetical protein
VVSGTGRVAQLNIRRAFFRRDLSAVRQLVQPPSRSYLEDVEDENITNSIVRAFAAILSLAVRMSSTAQVRDDNRMVASRRVRAGIRVDGLRARATRQR